MLDFLVSESKTVKFLILIKINDKQFTNLDDKIHCLSVTISV